MACKNTLANTTSKLFRKGENDVKPLKFDRRSQRTRALLSEALVALMMEKRYDDITVRDLLDRANVGRTTFYAHFQDKDDLLQSGFGRIVDQLSQGPVGAGAPAGQLLPSLELLRHIQSHRFLYLAMFRSQAITFIVKNIQGQFSGWIEQRLALLAGDHVPTVPLSVLANFVAGTFLTLVQWWMDSKTVYSPEQIDSMFWRLAQPSIQSVLEFER